MAITDLGILNAPPDTLAQSQIPFRHKSIYVSVDGGNTDGTQGIILIPVAANFRPIVISLNSVTDTTIKFSIDSHKVLTDYVADDENQAPVWHDVESPEALTVIEHPITALLITNVSADGEEVRNITVLV
mgnify:CR=1 FL=1